MQQIQIYDTTLRDGAQQEGLNLSIIDKLEIARLLDELGVGFIEGGWPGANPKDTGFFARAQTELQLTNAVLTAFGSTRKAGSSSAADDAQVRALLDSGAAAITLVAKSHVGHVERALRTDLATNLAMIRDTVSFLTGEGRRVILDAEHFFDGYVLDRDYALEAVRTAAEAGAETITLCDTNGGHLPHRIGEIVADTIASTGAQIGIHCHNDTGCAVANSVVAVQAGAVQVQGTVNGYGERTGNADLTTIIANLELKLDRQVLPAGNLAELTRIAHAVAEVTNQPGSKRQPYVGAGSFAHKAGLHASAIKVDADMYQHTDPALVGNSMRMLVSDMAGRASIELKGRELGFELDADVIDRTVARVKGLEEHGWTFDAADASFDLLLREELDGQAPVYFEVESWRVSSDSVGGPADTAGSNFTRVSTDAGTVSAEAVVKVRAAGQRFVAIGEGNGPVNALDHALRDALTRVYPELERIDLTDFRVRLLESDQGTDAVTRVIIDHSDGTRDWTTVGVGGDIVNASWIALTDGITYGLLMAGVTSRL